MAASMGHTLSLKVPFQDAAQAAIALRSLDPDPEVKPNEFAKSFTVKGAALVVEFRATTDRTLRVGVNSFMDSLGTVVECLDALGQ